MRIKIAPLFLSLTLFVIIIVAFSGCFSFKRVIKSEVQISKIPNEGELSVAENCWQLLDFSDLGFWVFGIKESSIQTLITPSLLYGFAGSGNHIPVKPESISAWNPAILFSRTDSDGKNPKRDACFAQ